MKAQFKRLLVGVAVFVSGCSPGPTEQCEVGSKGCACYPNRACNTGLECTSETCREVENVDSGGSGGSGMSETDVASSSGGSDNAGGSSAGGSGSTNGSASGGGAANALTNGGSGGSTTLSSSTTGDSGAAGDSATDSGGAATTTVTTAGGSGGTGGVGGSGNVETVNLYLMVEASTSMVDTETDGVTRWELVTAGISDFVSSPELAGREINVGLQFFAWVTDSSCDVSNYSTPLVDIDPIANVASTIQSELALYEPAGLTPTYPALSGAITYAKSWAAAAANDHTAVVLLTDGYPTRCEPQDISSLVTLATSSYVEAPSVPVHLVAIDGGYNLDAVAEAGGTNQAVLVENQADPTPLTAALVSIATSPFGD